ncbi:PR domain zinc finger protein 4 [Phlyctochytrium bullatum]|nr:PR domain zinc finger protein 4 [Phlyctochytrium bullatum]
MIGGENHESHTRSTDDSQLGTIAVQLAPKETAKREGSISQLGTTAVALAPQAAPQSEELINPVDLEIENVLEVNAEFTLENGLYKKIPVTIKRSAHKDLIEREIGFIRRANISEFVVSICGSFEQMDTGEMGLVTERYHTDLITWLSNAEPSDDLDDKKLDISEGVAKGLAHINRLGILHNDLKPENVFIDEVNKPYIGNFGAATNAGGELIRFTKRFFDLESVDLIPDQKSDSWLLGATLLEFWSGEMFSVHREISLDNIGNKTIKGALKALLQPRRQRSTAEEVLYWFRTINPKDLIIDKIVDTNEKRTIEKGIYKSLAVIVKRSTTTDNKDHILREIYYLHRASRSQNEFIISVGIIKGLAHINNLDILHNDLKPKNVFVDRFDKPFIGDFGVATNRGEPLIGCTKQYFDLESLELVPDEKSDSWLLGATLWEFWSDIPFSVHREILVDNIRNDAIKAIVNKLLKPREDRLTARQILNFVGSPVVNLSEADPLTQYWDALVAGSTDTLRAILAAGLVDVDSPKGRLTGLQFSCQQNWVEAVQTLLEFGADHQKQDESGRLPIQLSTSVDVWRVFSSKMHSPIVDIFEAVERDHDVAARLILAAEMDQSTKLSQQKDMKLGDLEGGVTPLHVAAFEGKVAFCKAFIDAGADVNSKSSQELTPLFYSISAGRLDVASFLLENGADIESRDKDGTTLLSYSISADRLDVARFLLKKGADTDCRWESDGASPLVKAAAKGNLVLAQLLLEHGADIESRSDGWTPLHTAAAAGHAEFVRFLLRKGASVETVDNVDYEHDKPIHLAAKFGRLEVVQVLVENGANIKGTGTNGETPLGWAAFMGGDHHVAVIRFLVEIGADINEILKGGILGGTYLHYAASRNLLEFVRFLVEKGADIEAFNQEKKTPLMVAAENGNLAVVQLLFEKGAISNHAQHLASVAGHKDVANFLAINTRNERAHAPKRSPIMSLFSPLASCLSFNEGR